MIANTPRKCTKTEDALAYRYYFKHFYNVNINQQCMGKIKYVRIFHEFVDAFYTLSGSKVWFFVL